MKSITVWSILLSLFFFVLSSSVAVAADFYVSPSGSSTGDGSSLKPWNLQTALSHPASVKPGDTIYILAGTYVGRFYSTLKGETDNPITVKASGRAILDANNNGYTVLNMRDTHWVTFWGLEITNSKNQRQVLTVVNSAGTVAAKAGGADGISSNKSFVQHHLKFINMIVHDVPAMGYAWWTSDSDSEIYGNLIYFNGVNELDHGVYSQNERGAKWINDSVVFDNASHGFSVYGKAAPLNNFTLDGNTLFENGAIGFNVSKNKWGFQARNILVGAQESVVDNCKVTQNHTYYSRDDGTNLNLGYGGGSKNCTLSNNYIIGGKFYLDGTVSNATIIGNTVSAYLYSGLNQSSYPNNTWLTTRPTTTKIFVRPNRYDTNRAIITVYNPSGASTVTLNASQLAGVRISPNTQYELRNVQDYFSDVKRDTYNGSYITIPMTGHTVAQPTGLSFKPASTFPKFCTFILITNSTDSIYEPRTTSTPTPRLTPTPTPRITNTPTSTPRPSPTPTPAPASTFRLNPTKDVLVRADSPRSNYGSLATLSSDKVPEKISYLGFSLDDKNLTYMTKAILRMYYSDSSSARTTDRQELRELGTHTWTESGTTYLLRPQITRLLSAGVPSSNTVYFDIDFTIPLSKISVRDFDFALTSTGDDGLDIYSSESLTKKPELIVTIDPANHPDLNRDSKIDGVDYVLGYKNNKPNHFPMWLRLY